MVLWLLPILWGPVHFAGAQDGAETTPVSGESKADEINPLALKEEMVRDRFKRFEDRVFRMREELSQAEPENAARLARVLERAGELELADRLEEIITLLQDPSALTNTIDIQAEWMQDADRLLSILLERDSDNEERRNEIDRLRAQKERLDEILEQERGLRDASAQATLARRMAHQLDQAIRRIDALLQQQDDLSTETARQGNAGDPADRRQLSDDQNNLARRTAELADDVERLAERKPDESADSPALQAARAHTADAAASIRDGADSMSQAGVDLREAGSEAAGRQQENAVQELQNARDRLQEAKRQLDESSRLQQMAEEQRDVAEQTRGLADDMQQGAAFGGEQGRPESQGGQQGPQPPVRQSVERAEDHMNDASGGLERDDPADAMQDQDRAIEELQQAQREMEETLNQLRSEERAETLRDLESRFREMLSRQRAVNEATVALDKLGRDNFKRAERLQLAELSAEERVLSDQAGTCLHILDEEGTTIVFPHVVGQLAEDMTTVADRLAVLRVGLLNQQVEREIVETLEQLIQAVQRMQQTNEQQAGDMQMSGQGNDPLLPTSAELKLLRSSQLRVNERTAATEDARADPSESQAALRKALSDTAARQMECAEVAREMRARRNRP